MKLIQLTQGLSTKVDDEVLEILSEFKWCVEKQRQTYYAVRGKSALLGTGRLIKMHRVLMGLQDLITGDALFPELGLEVDHANGDGLDNQRKNLRFVTHSQQMCNQGSYVGSSRFRGVTWHQLRSKWVAQIAHNGKHYYLGIYGDEADAARTYNQAALKLHGPYANINEGI